MDIGEFSDWIIECWHDLCSLSISHDESLEESLLDQEELIVDDYWPHYRDSFNSAFPMQFVAMPGNREPLDYLSAHAMVVKILEYLAVARSLPEEIFPDSLRTVEHHVRRLLEKERAALNLEESSNPTLDPLEEIRDLLSGKPLKLFDYLRSRDRPRTEFSTIRNDQKIHDGFRVDDPSDGTIKTALKRLKQDLEADSHALRHIAMTVGVDYVKFERLKPGDK